MLKETSGWKAAMQLKAEWKCASIMCGVQFAMWHGEMPKLESLAGNWECQAQVFSNHVLMIELCAMHALLNIGTSKR